MGWRPDCASARAAAAAWWKSAKRAVAAARKTGRSWRRIHASVMTPSAPSEPAKSRSGDGPAPDAGRRRVATVPRGVTTRRASTKSSMCVCSVAKWPPERVAIQPPSVENSKDCG